MARNTVDIEDRVQTPMATPEHDVEVVVIKNLRELPVGTYIYYNEALKDALVEFRKKHGSPAGVYYMESTKPLLRHVYIIPS